MSMPRFEAAGRYVIDWERRRLSSACCDAEIASKRAERWNDAVKRGLDEGAWNKYDWEFGAGAAAGEEPKPADCPDHYWAQPYQCMEVRNVLLEKAGSLRTGDAVFLSDWASLWKYVWRCMFKGQTISDLRKIEHYARILRERLEEDK